MGYRPFPPVWFSPDNPFPSSAIYDSCLDNHCISYEYKLEKSVEDIITITGKNLSFFEHGLVYTDLTVTKKDNRYNVIVDGEISYCNGNVCFIKQKGIAEGEEFKIHYKYGSPILILHTTKGDEVYDNPFDQYYIEYYSKYNQSITICNLGENVNFDNLPYIERSYIASEYLFYVLLKLCKKGIFNSDICGLVFDDEYLSIVFNKYYGEYLSTGYKIPMYYYYIKYSGLIGTYMKEKLVDPRNVIERTARFKINMINSSVKCMSYSLKDVFNSHFKNNNYSLNGETIIYRRDFNVFKAQEAYNDAINTIDYMIRRDFSL